MENKANMRKIDLSNSMGPTGFQQRAQMTPQQQNYQQQHHLQTPQPVEYNHFLNQSPYPQENYQQNPSQSSMQFSAQNISKQVPFQNITYNTQNTESLNPNFNFYQATKHMGVPSVSTSMVSTHRNEFHNSFITNNSQKTFNDSYEIQIPMRIRSQEREEWGTIVTVKIQVSTMGPHSHLVLQIELTDETDPFFLYNLECGENEFHNLKAELQLLVDFQNFPTQIVQMLELCSQNQDDSQSKFSCLLLPQSTGEGIFVIQESTQFRQMNHLQLKFKCGNDEGIKKLLAGKFKETKQHCDELKHKLESTEDTLGNCSNQNDLLKQELQGLKEENRRIVDEMNIEAQKKINDTKEKMLMEQSEQNAKSENDKRESSNKYEGEVGQLKGFISELTQKCEGISDVKRELEQQCRDQGIKIDSMSHNVEMMTSEVQELRGSNKDYEQYKYKQEKQITELSLTNQNLSRQVQDKDEILSKMNILVDTNRSTQDQIEDSLKTYKVNNSKMEEKLQASAQEIIKGNQIISKLQSENKQTKSKVKMTNKVVIQQEELINKTRSDMEDMKRVNKDFDREIQRKNDEMKEMQGVIDSLRFKQDESQKVLLQNNDMIQWLNKQLSESQQKSATGAKFGSTMASTKPYQPGQYTTSSSFKPSFSNISELNDRVGFQTQLPPQYPSTTCTTQKYYNIDTKPIPETSPIDHGTSYASKYTPFSMNDTSSMTNKDTIKRSPSASSISSQYNVAQYQESTLNQNFSSQNTASFNPSNVSGITQCDASNKFRLLNLEGSHFDAFSRKNCDESSEEVREYKTTSYNGMAEPMKVPELPQSEETMDEDDDNILPIKYTNPTGV